MNIITRTLKIDYLTPVEMATLFTDMGSEDQAEFFAEIWNIAREWPGAGWCMQSLGIVEQLEKHPGARSAITTLAAHLEPEA